MNLCNRTSETVYHLEYELLIVSNNSYICKFKPW